MVNYYDWVSWNEVRNAEVRDMWRDKVRMYVRSYRYYLALPDVAPGSLLSVKLALREAWWNYRKVMEVMK